MRADFDSEANAISIELQIVERFDYQEQVDDDYCNVGFANGQPVNVELLDPAEHLDLLETAAELYSLDSAALVAATQAALAAPDRVVSLEVAAPAAA